MKRLCKVVLLVIILSACRPWHGFAGVKGVDRPEGMSLHSPDHGIAGPEDAEDAEDAEDSPEDAIDEAIDEDATEDTSEDALDEAIDEENGEDEDAPDVKQAAIDFSPRTYSLGGFPRATSIVDIDFDGDLDIIVTNSQSHNITILLNKGDATFETGDSYPVEGYPIAITSIDIDKDSDIDIVVLDSNGMVRVFKQGAQGFSPAGGYIVKGYSFSMRPYDVDRDLDEDLIVLSLKTTTVLLNDGRGGFDSRLVYPGNITSPTHITLDLNIDNKDDMVIGDMEGISVLLNNTNDTFAKGVYYATGEMPVAVVAGDIDSDGDEDLIVANYKGNTISILRNDGDGGFQEVVDYPSGNGPNSISIEDIDMDEGLDIIVTNGLSGNLSVFINNTVMPLAVTTDSFPQGRIGLYYETRLEAKGGVPPYHWAVIDGSLPPSLRLDPLTGEIVSITKHGDEIASGTASPRNDEGEPLINLDPLCYCLKAPRGLYRFTVQVADSSSVTAVTATADLFIEVLPNPGTVSGTIRYSGEKKGDIRIGLYAQSLPGLIGFFLRPTYFAAISTSGEGGPSVEYKIEEIYPESYLVAAFLDVNGDGMKQVGEPYGVFGTGGPAGGPESIVVDNGSELTGIDIELVDSRQ